MIGKPEEFSKIIYTVCELLKADNEVELFEILNNSETNIEETEYDNWNGGTHYLTIYLNANIETFVKIRDRIEKIEADLLSRFEIATRGFENEIVSNIRIIPKAHPKLDWSRLSGLSTKDLLIEDVDYLKNVMVSVSTGVQRIQEVESEYKSKYNLVNKCLQQLNLQNPNPFNDLWD